MKLADMAPAPPPRTGVPCVFDRLHPLLDDDEALEAVAALAAVDD